MKHWAFILFVLLCLGSCRQSEIGKYLYLEISKSKNSCVIHTNKDCGRANKVLIYADEIYSFGQYRKGQWTFRYRGYDNTHLCFCAQCVSEQQMNAISDSIYSRHEEFTPEEIQGLIENLQDLKRQVEEQEKIESIDEYIDYPKRKWLYDNLRMFGYNVGNTYEEFTKLMDTNEESRKWCWERVQEHHLNLGGTYSDFVRLINQKEE